MRIRYLLITMLFPFICFAQTPYAVKFEDYRVKEIFKGKPAQVKLSSHPEASEWRTMLRTNAKLGPNFAGKYTIATWGAGTACDAFAIIDAKNGNVYFPENLRVLSWNGVDNEGLNFNYKKDSKLLIVVGAPNEQAEKGIFYYLWENNKLKLIKSDIRK